MLRSMSAGEQHLEVRRQRRDIRRQSAGLRRCRESLWSGAVLRRSAERRHRVDRRLSWPSIDTGLGRRHEAADWSWFHIVMRLQHAKQAAGGPATNRGQIQAKTAIVGRRSSDCTGGSGTARPGMPNSHSRTRRVMHAFNGEHGHRTTGVPSRKLWRTLHEVDNYLGSWALDSSTMLNDTAGLRVGTSVTEGPPTSSSIGV
jgi:hypothetical protein